jgi:diguanylate cyclase (GGDEF)-like protein
VSITLLYAALGTPRPSTEWRWLDLVGECGTALMAAYWTHIVLASRPAGRVTLLLALGLAGIALGMWSDGLDEVFSMKHAPRIDKWLESGLLPVGMALVTAGLVGWRREQFQLSDHMQLRERLFREHRDFDRITQLARIDYLREQVVLEQQAHPRQPASLVMIEVTGLQAVLHDHGQRDAVRALQAVTHQILLNLRNDDLLCRYSGDRFVLLLPRTPLSDALRTARHLQQMVAMTAFHDSDGRRATLGLHAASTAAVGDVAAMLSGLNRDLEFGGDAQVRPASA